MTSRLERDSMQKTLLTEQNKSRYRSQCLGKKYYSSEKNADRAAYRTIRTMGKTKEGTLRAYLCDFCLMWHIGHSQLAVAGE